MLEMVHGELTLSVPVDKAEEVGMRPPISKSDVEDLFRLIGKRDVREPANWSRRFKNHQEKMKSGDVYQVAEVVRNLALREKGKGLSTAEKSMLERARGILVSELSFALERHRGRRPRQAREGPGVRSRSPAPRREAAPGRGPGLLAFGRVLPCGVSR